MITITPMSESDEHRVVRAERPERGRDDALGGEHPTERDAWNHDPEAPDQHVDRADDVVEVACCR